MGGHQVTTLNLEVVQADAERELILVRERCPGPRGGVVVLRNTVKGDQRGGGVMTTATVTPLDARRTAPARASRARATAPWTAGASTAP